MISTVWPCLAARAPMAVAMLPAPMMLMVVMLGSFVVVGWVDGKGCVRASVR
jgi:hypothetical protein